MARPRKADPKPAQSYRYPEADLAARPEIGAQAHFKQAKPPATYRFDSSLAPELQWDGQNPARETAEHLIKEIANCGPRLADLAIEAPSSKRDQEITNRKSQIANLQSRLRGISGPFLNWSGKAERLSFDVPTLPLFIHERLSTKAILETLKGHKRDKQDDFLDALYGFQERPLADQLLRAYEYRDNWVNRLMLGDSMVVMNSLLRYESLGGQVQMIYMDPPYGVKFGSNFQPFVRKRDVSHNDDADLTREPEMVQAYRDTWELGLHSYLTYLRDRLLLARELLAPSGSIFVQISDENLHHVREVMDEVFGAENFVCVITFAKTSSATADLLPAISDYLIWYARDRDRAKYHSIYSAKEYGGESTTSYTLVELADGSRRAMSAEERNDPSTLPQGSRIYCLDTLTSSRPPGDFPVEFGGTSYRPRRGYWKTGLEGFEALKQQGRLVAKGGSIFYKRFFTDFPFIPLSHLWADTMLGGFAKSEEKLYVVQTSLKVIQRCLLMTTDPGDLVLDPTCGSGTTAYVAEQWGRRWITCDTSRVPLALARQRLLTATFDYYELKDEARGPAGGFVYRRKQNQKGEEVGGIVPHITLKSIANNEPPAEEVLVDRPELVRNVVRVTGPFSFEATIPMAEGLDTQPETPGIQGAQHETYVQRMIEVLRKAPVLRLPGNQTVTLKNIRPPAKTLALSAEALVDSSRTPALTPALSLRERENLSASPDKPKRANITPTREATPPLPAGEGRGEGERCALSETSGSSSQPVAILFGPENGPLSERLVREAWDEAGLKHYSHLYVIGFAIDPKARQFIDSAGKIGVGCTYLQATMDLQMGNLLKNMRSSQIFSVCGLPDVPAWFLDTDCNGMVFRVRQAFFPRTGAWENLKKALRVEFEETVWDHLAGTTSAPFPEGEHGQVAVKVIDPRGNELLVVRKLEEAK